MNGKEDDTNYADAPAGVTYTIMRNGFNMLFTVRDSAGNTLLDKMDVIEKKLTEKGYQPQPTKSYGGYVKKEPEYVEGRACPTCGKRLIYADTSKGKVIKCEDNKWDKINKRPMGCSFIEWPDSDAATPQRTETAPATTVDSPPPPSDEDLPF